MSDAQFGFRPGCSIVDAIKKVFGFGRRARRGKKFAILITLDIKNAFNCVPWHLTERHLGGKARLATCDG